MRDDELRLLDIQEAIANIEAYAGKGKEAFLQDKLIRVWMVHHLQIIGEAAANLSSELRQRNADVPWANAIAMRNILVHEYFGVDLEQVWKTVRENLPRLKQDVEGILKRLSL